MVRHPVSVCLALALGWATLVLTVGAEEQGVPAGWTEVNRSDKVVVYGRQRPGSSIQELRGVGVIDAPNWALKNVLDDTEHYADFMPNIIESRVVARDSAHHTLLTYSKLQAPLISPRDYTVMVRDLSHAREDGQIVYHSTWEVANSKGPAEKPGVTRVGVTDGSWLLEPLGDGQKTRATYQLYTDGGGLPAMVLNQASKRRIDELFAAIGRRAQGAAYRKSKPSYP